MAKATTKTQLISDANDNFSKLFGIIDSFSQQQQEQNFTFDADELTTKDNAQHWKRDKNLRDVLVHLYEWHQLIITWIEANKNGENVPFLPKPYTWTTYQQMNVEFFNKHQSTLYGTAEQMLKDSHKQVVALMDNYSDAELFEKKRFSWVGTTSLGQYFHSATTAHYDWAIKKLKAYQKSLKS